MIKIQLAAPVKKKLKILLYGPSGSGKTRAALTFPRVLLVDAEAGSDLYRGRPDIPSFHVADIKTLSDMEDVLRQVEADRGKTWDTLAIDPISVFYAVEKNVGSANNTKDLGFREWAKINNRMNSLYIRLTGLDIHVVLLAREAVEYAGEGNNLRKVGVKPDADKNLVYSMDFVVRLNADHTALVEKSRGVNLGKDGLLSAVTWNVFEPVSQAFMDGQTRQYEDDEQAAEREADNLQNMEVATRFIQHWRQQAVTDADVLRALGVSRLSEWTDGKAKADAAVLAYIARQTANPATPKNGDASH